MNSSLRDQLLAAGLVTEKQAKQAAQQEQQRQFRNRARPPADTGPRGKPPAPKAPPVKASPPSGGAVANPPPAKLQAQQLQAAKIARDMELNRRREEKAQRKARIAQIEQIIEQNRLPRLDTDDHYSFIDGKKIRRMSVDAERRAQLTSGALIVVRYRGHYAVVPNAVAERIRERDASMIVSIVEPKPATETDDTYKDFAVPDDLMW